MHYESTAFAIYSNAPTITPTRNTSAFIGQRVRLSPIDILEIQRGYGCVPTITTTSVTGTSTITTTQATPGNGALQHGPALFYCFLSIVLPFHFLGTSRYS